MDLPPSRALTGWAAGRAPPNPTWPKGTTVITARKATPIVLFAVCAAAANWLTTRYGFVPVGFGFTVTAGTYAAGAALVIRDAVHDTSELRGVAVAIALGVTVSLLTADPRIAVASGAAFLLSETADALVYTPLRQRRWRSAVVASSVVGAVLDTAVFLALAFGLAAVTWQSLGGQLLGKVLWVAIPYAVIAGTLRERRAVTA